MSDQTPHRCPVCNGNGLVSNGFYSQTSGQWTSSSTEPEQCRSCAGAGVIWSAYTIISGEARDDTRNGGG